MYADLIYKTCIIRLLVTENNELNLSVENDLSKLWHNYTIKSYSAVKKNEVYLYEGTWTDL